MNVVRVGCTGKDISNYLKNVFNALGVIYVRIHNELESSWIAEERELQIAIVVECLEAVCKHKIGRRRVKLAGDVMEKIGRHRIDGRISQILVHVGEKPVSTNTSQRMYISEHRPFVRKSGMLHLCIDV